MTTLVRHAVLSDCAKLGDNLRPEDLREVLDDDPPARSGQHAVATSLACSLDSETFEVDGAPAAMAGWCPWPPDEAGVCGSGGKFLWLLTTPAVDRAKASFWRWACCYRDMAREGGKVALYCEVDYRYRRAVALLTRLGFRPIAKREVRSGLDFVLMELPSG